MTSITWAGPRCVQEPAAILAPQNRTQGRCEIYYQQQTRHKLVDLIRIISSLPHRINSLSLLPYKLISNNVLHIAAPPPPHQLEI